MILKQKTTSPTLPLNPTQSNLKILLVEKSWPDQRLITKMLESKGCMVTAAANLQEAGSLIKSIDVDMVLMDTNIFKCNGFDIMAAIQDSEKKAEKRIPIIALAQDFNKERRDYYIRIGMDDFLPKPVFEEDLFRTVIRFSECNENETMMAI